MYAAIIQCLNYNLTCCDLETRSRSSNLIDKSLDTQQCYNHAKFERPYLNSAQEKQKQKKGVFFVKLGNMFNISLEYKCKFKKSGNHVIVNVVKIHTKLYFDRMRT